METIKDWVATKLAKNEKLTNFFTVTGLLQKLTVCAASSLLE